MQCTFMDYGRFSPYLCFHPPPVSPMCEQMLCRRPLPPPSLSPPDLHSSHPSPPKALYLRSLSMRQKDGRDHSSLDAPLQAGGQDSSSNSKALGIGTDAAAAAAAATGGDPGEGAHTGSGAGGGASERPPDHFSDAVSMGACAVVYLLGQHLRFQLHDMSLHALTVADYEAHCPPVSLRAAVAGAGGGSEKRRKGKEQPVKVGFAVWRGTLVRQFSVGMILA